MESRKTVRIYLQGSNGETDVENRFMDMGTGVERVRCMERVTWKLTLPYVKQIPTGIYCMSQETQTGALYQPRGERDRREAQMGGDICILMADSC